ncbi:MAG: DUF481 domain-containing protein [Phycisphaerales bacterium]|nr:DUF481 domain-containing protein [Phycisphaerales bacterium]
MNKNRMNTAAIIAIVAGMGTTGLAAEDTTTALERLEAARVAFEQAKIELAAAQAAVSGEISSGVQVDAETDATRRAQPEEEAEVPADPTSWSEGWEWAASVAMTGSSGNTENFGARAAIDGERNTSDYETSLSLSYIYGTSDGTKNTSRGQLALRNDWLTEGKWRYFAEGKYEYDEFQIWEHRLSGAVGVGYELIKNDKQTLIGRVGVGGSYEMGGAAKEEFIPEGLIGLDWEYKISDNSTLTASTTYYPSFDDLGEFRWNNNAGLEVVMDAETGMTLNTGFEHRHDSDPGSGFKPNDLNYYMGLGWKF